MSSNILLPKKCSNLALQALSDEHWLYVTLLEKICLSSHNNTLEPFQNTALNTKKYTKFAKNFEILFNFFEPGRKTYAFWQH